ncbi:zwei Ig domain protein zig-8 [Bactrocera dorsalis]|uniref:Zwei Ig domain protein zig-8 n=1 Tax=Bactrocera dorsalis TaxID=27457 RepID=A0ABM3JH46_BACDO|nr:zwei Ig domain protein zig-8 [Bactrocera dorsalis]
MSSSSALRVGGAFSSGMQLLLLLAAIQESLSSYSTTTSTTTVSPANLLPYFDFDVPRNLTVTVGQTGFLHCRVERLGDKDVSWIRKRDLHILTAGSTTYTSDQRFQVIRPENSGNWTLQIKYPQQRDSGIYECQINTEPKMSLSYTFNVIELKANIIGPTDLYVKSGSDINLTCRIMQGPHELGNIFWYKGTEIIDMSANLNEIDSATRISVDNDWTDGLTSRLKIRRAMPSDTGNYTCVPTIAKSSSVYVHVIIGEHPAAMQHNSSSMYSGNFYCSICCMLFTIFTCCLQHFLATTTAAATLLTVATRGASKCSRSNNSNNNDGGGGGSECRTSTSAALSTARTTNVGRCVSIGSCQKRHYQRHRRSRSCSRSPSRISISGATARSSHATRALSEITR